MDEQRVDNFDEIPEEVLAEEILQEAEAYKPRPGWQIWAARLGLVIVIIAIALYYFHIARGG